MADDATTNAAMNQLLRDRGHIDLGAIREGLPKDATENDVMNAAIKSGNRESKEDAALDINSRVRLASGRFGKVKAPEPPAKKDQKVNQVAVWVAGAKDGQFEGYTLEGWLAFHAKD